MLILVWMERLLLYMTYTMRLAFHLCVAKNFFNNFFRICLSVACCRIQQLTKIVHDLSAFRRVCLRNLLQRGGGVI